MEVMRPARDKRPWELARDALVEAQREALASAGDDYRGRWLRAHLFCDHSAGRGSHDRCLGCGVAWEQVRVEELHARARLAAAAAQLAAQATGATTEPERVADATADVLPYWVGTGRVD